MKLVDVAKIGDYVDYNAIISRQRRYIISENETIYREHMNWRVLKNDGKNVFLISEKPTESKIHLEGSEGYLEGPSMLNRVARELYSSKIAKARNINVEDVNQIIGYKTDKAYVNGEEVPYGITISRLEKSLNKPLLYRKTPDEKMLERYRQTYYKYYGEKYKSKNNIGYKLIFGDNSNYYYWLSSSCVNGHFGGEYAVFCERFIDGGGVFAYYLYFSYGTNGSGSYPIRPIVILNSSVCVTNENSLGETVDTAWKLK